jgi:hypothetical protein
LNYCCGQRKCKYSNHHHNITITILIVNQTYYEMKATDKRSLKSEIVVVSRIDIHPTRKEPDQHAIRVTPGVSHTETICEVPTMSKLVPCSKGEVLAPSDTRLGHHPGLPHFSSNKPCQSRGAIRQSSYWAARFTEPHKNPTCGQYKSKLAIGAKTTQSLIDTNRCYHLGTLE